MIYIERTINISDNNAKIEEPVVLYKGDGNIEVQFTITNNPFKYKAGIDLTYGQLIIKRPATDPIFSDVAKLSSNKENSKVHLVITGEMIDELVELGNYDFQIRLLNTDMSSRATLPPVTAGILIKEPICEETVNTAPVNYSRAAINRETVDTFDEEGNYNKTNWSNGDIITDKKLNKIEDAIYTINDNNGDYASKDDIPTAVSQLDNDAGYITDISHLAQIAYVDEQIANIELIPGPQGEKGEQGPQGEQGPAGKDADPVDLDGYATKEEIPTNMSQLNNDANYMTSKDVEKYATIDYVDEAIANIEVSGGGDVNLKDYVTKENPEMIGTFSLNRNPDSLIGDFSVAIGENTSAEGEASHAEGYETSACGEASHAEGWISHAGRWASHAEGWASRAEGEASHAEGQDTRAEGLASHAEGKETVADSEASHAEGKGTIAKGKCQHVQGRYNIEDEEKWEEYDWEGDHYRYAHIVGNGRNDRERSNAYTLDWKGNAWFAGRAYVGEENSHERKQLATEEYVDDRIRNIEVSGGVDLSNYVTKEDHYMDIAYKSDIDHRHDDMYLGLDSLKGYATESYVQEVIGNIDAILDALNGEVL